MITFLNLGKKGNLGNQLFQIASTIGIAESNNHRFCFPDWQYSKYFEYDFPIMIEREWTVIQEERFNFYNWEIGEGNYSLNGWLQSEKYFQNISVRDIFKFKDDFLTDVEKKAGNLVFDNPIVISVRRGDFVCSPYYYQLTYKYYLAALCNFFPDFEKRKLLFISDDINYCKKQFSSLKNAVFLENYSPMEQLVLCSKFDDFVISNSTFSWWVAWLGEKESSKIIRPIKNFDGSFVEKYNEIDYFPSRWIKFDYLNFKLPLKYYKIIIYGEFNNLRDKLSYNKAQFIISLKKKIKRLISK